ncbi:MAG: bifunctional phosphopantothenoylcysteine decarboxylase/phosphopantothenate--cysteine ligase CoaBC [Chloroflexi bacterium]|nr:bifunctional phosphopantothenoylcysteine decarboxylase/phosphopantothenate--cysteine ligase CoaBC [Chloroflexota bacterium]
MTDNALSGRRIGIAVCGGIAAYKIAGLVSTLAQEGAEVDVLFTRDAARFVSPLTFQALTHRPVHTDPWELGTSGSITHVALARTLEVLVVAPVTAHTLARLAHGFADDMVTLVALATAAPVILAPAMDAEMYQHPAVRHNVALLQERGCRVIGPATGRLASGLVGIGRLADIPEILAEIEHCLAATRDLAGVRITVTAGGTQEPIDPVRFIGNRSSGKMGYAIAEVAQRRGAEVTLISGPVALIPPAGVHLKRIRTALELRSALHAMLSKTDVVVQAAAVADYRMQTPEQQKIKRTGATLTLQLVENPDIIAEIGAMPEHPLLIGFAAETGQNLEVARSKLRRKGLDLIVFNDITREGSGFGTDTNEVTLLPAEGEPLALPLLSKHEVAEQLLAWVSQMLHTRRQSI